MGDRNRVGIGLSYRPASLCSLATQFQTWFLESIPSPIAGLKFLTQYVSYVLHTPQEESTGEEEGAPELWVHVDAGIR
jgi:hypothetical protein